MDSPAVQDIMRTAIGPQPSEAMHWPQALEALGLPREAALLRQALLQRWLAGTPGNASETVAQAIGSASSEDGTARAREAPSLWNTVLASRLRIALPDASVPLPDEIDALRARLVEQRPGVWVLRGAAAAPAAGATPDMAPAPSVFAWVALHNTGSQSMALGPFDLALPLEGAAPGQAIWSLACQLPRTQQARPMAPGQATHYLCRAQGLPVQRNGQDAGAVLQAAQQQGRLQIRSSALDTEAGRDALVTTLAQPRQAALQAFLASSTSCERRGTCSAAAQARAEAAKHQPAARQRASRDWSGLKAWGILIGGALVYVAIARYVSVVAASVALFVALAIPAYFVVQSARGMNTADNWGGFVVIPMMLMAFTVPVAAPLLAAKIYRTAIDAQARHRALQSAGYFVIVVLGMALINKILHLLS